MEIEAMDGLDQEASRSAANLSGTKQTNENPSVRNEGSP